jgi:ABC-2 type transport system permease protein
MQQFTGTWRLIRLALRRDRIKLPVWIFALALVLAANVPAVTALYGKSMAEQVTYAASIAPSMSGRIFGGPVGGPDIGAIVLNETFLFMAIAVVFMSTLTVVRHTRQNEETGRSELIGAGIVGRSAGLAAALIVAIGANILLSLLIYAGLLANGLEPAGSLGTAAALGAIGIAFAGVAAVTAQISESARGANSLAAAVLGVAFLLRAVGDALGNLTADKLAVVSAWPSWLSPLGWVQQIHPYTLQRWWIFGLAAAFTTAAIGAAFYLNSHRDLGAGLLATRKGPAHAPKALLGAGAFGLVRRLQRGVLRGWAVGIGVMGLTVGLVGKEYADMFLENEDVAKYLESVGGTGRFEDIYFAAMMAIMGIAIAGYALQALQRLRSEEAGGQLEGILSTAVSKQRWALGHVAYTAAGAVALLALLGVSGGLTYVLIVPEAQTSYIWSIVGAALAQAPAVLAVMGFAVALFGLSPRAVIAVTWSAFGALLLLSQFGAILKLPQWVMNVSPFTHLTAVPAKSPAWEAMAILLGAALALGAIGIAAFRRRDITTG